MMDKVNIFNSSDELILSVYPDDTSYRYKAIMGENTLTLKFSLETFIEFEVDSYIDYKAERYFLWDAGNIVKENTRNFDYTLQLQTYAALLGTKQFKFFTVDGLGNPIPPYKVKGSYSGTPQDFLTLIVRNMNDGDSGWSVGSCIVGEAKLMSFNQLTCSEFLTQVANEYKTEWEIIGKTISLGKVEKDKESPVPLSYGFGNGFKSGVKRDNGDTSQINRLLVQGGSTNIDKSKYRIYNMVGSDILLLPANATKVYNGVTYQTDAFGTYVQRDGLTGRIREGSYENVDIYPQRVGTVSSVVTVDAVKHFYDIVDSSIPMALDYNAAMIDGEVRTIIFQTGALSGQEFDIQNYYHEADDTHAARTFEIVPKEDAGTALPSGTLIPAVGDKYIIYHISMPQTYIDTAEQGLLDKAVEVLYENEQGTFTFTGELDGIYAKTNWLTIGSKLNCGYFVSFTDAQFQTDPVLIRIVGVREYLNKPYEPILELTNNVQAKTLASTLRDRDADEVRIDNSYINSLAYTKRRWRDAKETMKLLQDAFDNFGAGINPIWVQTMSLLVGDESLQYRFVNSKTTPSTIADTFVWNNTTKIFSNQVGIIQHMTIGIKDISSSYAANKYKYWDIPAYTSPVMTDLSANYIYLKCSKTTEVGAVILSKTAFKLDPNDGYYYFLVGTLSSEVEGERSFVTLYGFTEILPGRITVDRIISPDGYQFFDMLNSAFRIGNATNFLSYNTEGDNFLKVQRLKIVSPSGDIDFAEVYRGTYLTTATYYQGDKVYYNGSFYKCKVDGTINIVPTNTANWTIAAMKGDPGSAGAAAVVAVLTNSYHGIPTDSAGNNGVYTNATTTINLYVGGVIAPGEVTYSFAKSDASITISNPVPNRVDVISMGVDNAYITCTATYNGLSYSQVFKLAKIKAGSAGQDGVSYWLSVNNDVIIKTKNVGSTTYSPTALSFYPRKQVGTNEAGPTGTGTTFYMQGWNGTSWVELSGSPYVNPSLYTYTTPAINGTYTKYRGLLYYGTTLLDSVEVQIIEDYRSVRDELAFQIGGFNSYDDYVAFVTQNGSIIMAGGYINADLIDVEALVANNILVTEFANIVGTYFQNDAVTFTQQNGITFPAVINGTSTSLDVNPQPLPDVSTFTSATSLTGTTNLPAAYPNMFQYETYEIASTSYQAIPSGVTSIKNNSFTLSGNMTIQNRDFEGYSGFVLKCSTFARFYNGTSFISDTLIAYSRIDRTGDFSTYSFLNGTKSIAVPSGATNVKLIAQFQLTILNNFGEEYGALGFNGISSSAYFYNATGVYKSRISPDGYALARDSSNYFHLKANGTKVLLSFMGDISSNSIQQKLVSCIFEANGTPRASGGYGKGSGFQMNRVSTGIYRVTHNMGTNLSLVASNYCIQATSEVGLVVCYIWPIDNNIFEIRCFNLSGVASDTVLHVNVTRI